MANIFPKCPGPKAEMVTRRSTREVPSTVLVSDHCPKLPMSCPDPLSEQPEGVLISFPEKPRPALKAELSKSPPEAPAVNLQPAHGEPLTQLTKLDWNCEGGEESGCHLSVCVFVVHLRNQVARICPLSALQILQQQPERNMCSSMETEG